MNSSFLSPGANTGGNFGDFPSEEDDITSTCVGSYQGTPVSWSATIGGSVAGRRQRDLSAKQAYQFWRLIGLATTD